MESQLLVPVARDETGNIVRPQEAVKGRRHFCPCCGDEVVLHAGEIKVRHFAHHPGGTCTAETVAHKAAKLLIQKAVREWKIGGGPAPEIERECSVCSEYSPQALPATVTDAVLEERLPDGFIVDVGLLGETGIVAAIEVRVAHEVDEEKAGRLSVPFVEVEGAKVIEGPNKWRALRDTFRPLWCQRCREAFKTFIKTTQEIARETGVEIPSSYYRYAPRTCHKCRKSMLAFTWPGHSDWNKTAPTVAPKPKTVQYRSSKMAEGKYWANVCPFCDALQGDWFLHSEPDGPFFGLECGPDTPEAFAADLRKLAWWAERRREYA